MTINFVNLGQYPNDGTGDDLRTAFEKTNSNISFLNSISIKNAENLGTGEGVFKNATSNELKFKTLRSLSPRLEISFDENSIIFKTIEAAVAEESIRNFDFGKIKNTFSSPISYLLSTVGMDYGGIFSPSDLSIDFNSIVD
jgi:hypothetical protein